MELPILNQSLSLEDKIKLISEFLLNNGARFVQYKDSPMVSSSMNFNQLGFKAPNVLFIDYEMEDLIDGKEYLIERWIGNVSVKYSSCKIL